MIFVLAKIIKANTIIRMELEFDPTKDAANIAKHGLSLADAMLVYEAESKLTLQSNRQGEDRPMDLAMVEVARVVLVWFWSMWFAAIRYARSRCAARHGLNGGSMNKPLDKAKMTTKTTTDWERVRAEAEANAPVARDPATEPYDPNDETATRAFWATANIVRPGRPRVAVERPTLNMRVDADLMKHLRQSGKGWQTRVNKVLREAVEHGTL